MNINKLVIGFGLALVLASPSFCAQQTESDSKALADLRTLAKKGKAEAQYDLGKVLFLGKLGVKKDEKEAVKWYRKAAEQNLAAAQCSLGACYANGRGVSKDEKEAVQWYRRSAEQNFAQAQCSLGVCYRDGVGVTKNEEEAVQWYRKAAEQNDPGAQYNLGVSYAFGQGVAKDEIEAVKWYRKAAWQNEPQAQYNLGVCYAKGVGVVKDLVEAYKWAILSAAQGDEDARRGITILENRMSPEEIAQGQKLARSFKPGEPPSTGSEVSSARPACSGTGFFITEDGYLITNEHVAGIGAQVRLVTAAGTLPANVVKVDAANDLALLKAEGNFAPLAVTTSRAVKVGGTVFTVGFPDVGSQEFAPKLAEGAVTSLAGSADDARYFQISVPVQPGNSGGALVDERGNVVGVVSAKLHAPAPPSASDALPENVRQAVKSSYLLSFLESVPEVAAKLKEPATKARKFDDGVKSAEQAAALVLAH